MSNTINLGKVKTKQDIDAIPKITLYNNYECYISGHKFIICPVKSDDGIFYSIFNTEYTFEELIQQTYNISVERLFIASLTKDKKIIFVRDYQGKLHRAIGYTNKSDTIDYLLIVLRQLMTLCVNIEVVDWDDDMLVKLKKYGLTVAPYGETSLLSPDLSGFENSTYNNCGDEIIDDKDLCLKIMIKKKKSLQIDFHE